MTCAAQAAEILASRSLPHESLLDAGCGGGFYYWSFHERSIAVDYYGLDYTPAMIDLARTEMGALAGLPSDHFILDAIENLDQVFDTVLCFNVLTNSPHYALPLERLLNCARRRILLRENMGETLTVHYAPDHYLDEDKRHIRVYHNQYPLEEVKSFMASFGFKVTQFVDQRTNDGIEMVTDVPHQWRILLGERIV